MRRGTQPAVVAYIPDKLVSFTRGNNMKHIHAELMMEYAKDALETSYPWQRWESKFINDQSWSACCSPVKWWDDRVYRRKQKTITINNIEVPEPYRGELTHISDYYIACPEGDNYYGCCGYQHAESSIAHYYSLRNKGLVHLTKEAAQIHGKALASFTEAG